MSALVDAVRARATLGEITAAIGGVVGFTGRRRSGFEAQLARH